jgi:signal transduction histidine kinase
VMRPVAVLAEHLSRGRDGPLVPVPEAAIGRERSAFARLFTQYNALVRAVNEREQLAQHLAEEERLASLGRLASGMAHEINNPLGGMQTLVDTLETHGEKAEVRRQSLALLQRGLAGIRDVVRSALATYKRGSGESDLVPSDLDDLRYLIQHEVARRRLVVQWDNRLPDRVAVDGGAVRQAALNLLLNACAATPVGGSVRLAAEVAAATVRIEVADQGGGLPPGSAAILTAPGRLTPVPGPGGGLGLWMVSRLLRELGGGAEVASAAGRGTRITLAIPLRQGEAVLGHVA